MCLFLVLILQLRDEKFQIQEAMKNECFICRLATMARVCVRVCVFVCVCVYVCVYSPHAVCPALSSIVRARALTTTVCRLCSLCSLTRTVKYDHNMWNYLFFMMHLSAKDESEYTAAVRRQHSSDDV